MTEMPTVTADAAVRAMARECEWLRRENLSLHQLLIDAGQKLASAHKEIEAMRDRANRTPPEDSALMFDAEGS